jgi:putative endonuclease
MDGFPAPAAARPFQRLRAAHLRLGARGERLARTLLKELGLCILTRNYRGRHGEIDIVAREDDVLCFVEVKTRRRPSFGRPADAVGRHKQLAISRTASGYRRDLGSPPILYRFDIVEVVFDRRRLRDVRYWRNAFPEPLTTRP